MMRVLLIAMMALSAIGCSTTGHFKVPAGTDLFVAEQQVPPASYGEYKRRPFFWSKVGGIPYMLKRGDNVVETGTIGAKFRVVSIFWPPYALIYWPVGFKSEVYDFTTPNLLVRPTGGYKSQASEEAAPAAKPAKSAKPAKK